MKMDDKEKDWEVGGVNEKPVPSSESETYRVFKAALDKARLMYEFCEESQNYQFALLYNGDGLRGRTDHAVMFTSSIDKKVHLKQLDYDDVWYLQAGKPALGDGLLMVWRNCTAAETFLTGRSLANGMLSHTGRVILPTKHNSLRPIGQGLITGFEPEDGKVGKGRKFWDTAGNLKLEFPDNIRVEDDRLYLDGEWIPIIFEHSYSKILKDKRKNYTKANTIEMVTMTIYIGYKGNVYKVYERIGEPIVRTNENHPNKWLLSTPNCSVELDKEAICRKLDEIDGRDDTIERIKYNGFVLEKYGKKPVWHYAVTNTESGEN